MWLHYSKQIMFLPSMLCNYSKMSDSFSPDYWWANLGSKQTGHLGYEGNDLLESIN